MDLVVDHRQEEIVQIVGFHVGERLFGTHIMSVREILRDPALESYDDALGVVAGVIKLRGQTIPVLDLKQRMGWQKPKSGRDDKQWVLIVYIEDMMVGLVADSVTRIYRIEPGSILPAPEIITYGMNSPYVQGVFESDQGMLILLDLKRLLDGDEIKAVKAALGK